MTPELLTFDVAGNDQLFISPHTLACYQWGNPDAKNTIICLHGLTRNARDFDFLAQALASDCRVLCPDMPGRGKSGKLANPAGYNYTTYVADMQYLLASLRLSRVHWVGTSMGGIIGMMLANAHPGLIQSLTLNDVGCLIPAAGLKRILSYAGVKMQFATRAEAEATLRDICKPFGIHDEKHWQHLFTYSLEDMLGGGVRFAYDANIVMPFAKDSPVMDVNLWPLWPMMTAVPILLIHGAQSDILTHGTALSMQEQHPNLTLYEVADAGHAPALMADEQITFIKQWMNNWLKN